MGNLGAFAIQQLYTSVAKGEGAHFFVAPQKLKGSRLHLVWPLLSSSKEKGHWLPARLRTLVFIPLDNILSQQLSPPSVIKHPWQWGEDHLAISLTPGIASVSQLCHLPFLNTHSTILYWVLLISLPVFGTYVTLLPHSSASCSHLPFGFDALTMELSPFACLTPIHFPKRSQTDLFKPQMWWHPLSQPEYFYISQHS